jgi:spermidine synthase
LVPEVVIAASNYMTNVEGYDFTGGLFSDPRASVKVEDGRHYLMASDKTFDLINSDLFVPFRSGAGSLYSLEHFESVKASLNPGGVFFQWLPLYQLTEYEVMIIARTMLEVFDQVTLWRNNFQPGEEVIAMAGHKSALPLPATDVDSFEDMAFAVAGKGIADLERLQLPLNSQTILLFYCGNMSKAKQVFQNYPLNTDDKPLIEYMAPRTYRNRKDTTIPWFVGPRIAKLIDAVLQACPPEDDPFLSNRSEADRRLPTAGAAYHWARVWAVIGDKGKCQRAWTTFVDNWLADRVENED